MKTASELSLPENKPTEPPALGRLFYFSRARARHALDLAWAILPAGALFFWLRSFHDPSGANGYFYLKQTETIANLHELYFKDRSLAFLPLVALYKLTGDSLLAYQAAIALTAGGLLLGVRRLIGALARSAAARATDDPSREPGDARASATFWMVAASLAINAHFLEFSLTFFKNFFAFTLLIWALSRLLRPQPAWKSGVALLGMALLSHKSMFLLIAVLGLVGAARAIAKAQSTGARKVAVVVGAAAVAASCLLLLFLKSFERGHAYLEALGSFFSARPLGLSWLASHAPADPSVAVIYATAAMFLLAYLGFRKRVTSPALRIFGDTTCLLILVAAQPFQIPGPSGPAYRILVLLPVFMLTALAALIAQTRAAAWLGVFVFAAQLAQLGQLHRGYLTRYIPPWSAHREEALAIKRYVRAEDHLTSHHGLEFFIDYVTGIRSRSFLSDHAEKTAFRLAYVPPSIVPDSLARDELNQVKLADFDVNYVLVREEDWAAISNRYLLASHWKNPEGHRPAYIYE